MKYINFTALMFLGGAMFAQAVASITAVRQTLAPIRHISGWISDG